MISTNYTTFGSLVLIAVLAGCVGDRAAPEAVMDLGSFPDAEKGDQSVTVEVPFEVPRASGSTPGSTSYVFRTDGRLRITTQQDRDLSWERLQISAESADYRRRSWRGRSPHISIPASKTPDLGTEYVVDVLNWGNSRAYGLIRVETEIKDDQPIRVVFNQPDCSDCDNPAGELRNSVVDAVQAAEKTIDFAIYGFNDPVVLDALCEAAAAGVRVRVVTDDHSLIPDVTRSYYEWLYSDAGLKGCGAEVVPVRSSGLMHHKFMIIDAGEPEAILVTGSTNMTTYGFDRNHNHLAFLRSDDVIEAYQQEFDQFLRQCSTDRLDDRTCSQCTASCAEDRSDEGPFAVGGTDVSVYFNPSDDALRVLRGDVRVRRMENRDTACDSPDGDCVCRRSGSRWACEYCAQDEDGFGLLGEATDRVVASVYSATDQCFGLAMARAHERGVEVLALFDMVTSSSPYSRDDYVCGAGVPTYVSLWAGGNALVRNHNKLVVVDDTVFDGSMNISASGGKQNNENTLVYEDAGLADTFAEYVQSEVRLLESLGVTPLVQNECLGRDLVDNDADGMIDQDDPDCDGTGCPLAN